MKIQKLFDLKGTTAVVTGGASHLGMSISEGLSEAGADVYIAGRSKAKCNEAAKLLQDKTSTTVKGIGLDIRSSHSIHICFKTILKEKGRIDVLVNNASFSTNGKLEKISEKDWIKGIDGTINGVFRATQGILPIMERQGSGSIINISSMYGMVSPDPSIYGTTGFDNPPNYGAGKAAIIQFTRYAACHMAKKGIRVNSISPGAFPKPEVQKNSKFISKLEMKIPLGRIGQPYELKGAIVFLASKASSYVTGQNIVIDGGWTAW